MPDCPAVRDFVNSELAHLASSLAMWADVTDPTLRHMLALSATIEARTLARVLYALDHSDDSA